MFLEYCILRLKAMDATRPTMGRGDRNFKRACWGPLVQHAPWVAAGFAANLFPSLRAAPNIYYVEKCWMETWHSTRAFRGTLIAAVSRLDHVENRHALIYASAVRHYAVTAWPSLLPELTLWRSTIWNQILVTTGCCKYSSQICLHIIDFSRLIRINNCLQCLACICDILAIFCSDLKACADCVHYIADCFYHCVSGCMTAQVRTAIALHMFRLWSSSSCVSILTLGCSWNELSIGE